MGFGTTLSLKSHVGLGKIQIGTETPNLRARTVDSDLLDRQSFSEYIG